MINTEYFVDIKIINEQNNYNLNRREIEVINLILQEYSTTRIAKTLGLKSKTISTFKKSIFLSMLFVLTSALFAGSTVHHKLSVTINPAAHSVDALDQISIYNYFKSLNKYLYYN